MKFNVFTSLDDNRVIVMHKDGGLLFTPETDYRKPFRPERLVYDEMGNLFAADSLDGSDFDLETMKMAWAAANEFWSRRQPTSWPNN